jgi:hypothetical protein
MATTPKQAVSVIANRIVAMQAGFQKDFTPKQSLVVEGNTMLVPAILAQLAAELALVTAADNARTALAAAVAARKAGAQATTKFLDALESVLKMTFGSGGAQLQDFGIKPPKAKKVLTVEEKALAVAESKATKKARGIIGKNQRSAITTQGKPGLAVVDPQGNLVPGALTGPTPPGSGTPVDVTALAPAPAPATPAASSPPSPAGTTAAPVGGATPTTGNGQ